MILPFFSAALYLRPRAVFWPSRNNSLKLGLAWSVVSIAAVSLLAGCSGPVRKASSAYGVRANNPIVINSQKRNEVVLTAMALLEERYKYGGTAPTTGFDCSGLVAYVFNSAASEQLPHNSAEIAQLSRPVAKDQLSAGDFVFFNTLGRRFSHMGIYIGEGRFVNAPSSGGKVRIDTLHNPYFAKRFDGARTLFDRQISMAGPGSYTQ